MTRRGSIYLLRGGLGTRNLVLVLAPECKWRWKFGNGFEYEHAKTSSALSQSGHPISIGGRGLWIVLLLDQRDLDLDLDLLLDLLRLGFVNGLYPLRWMAGSLYLLVVSASPRGDVCGMGSLATLRGREMWICVLSRLVVTDSRFRLIT